MKKTKSTHYELQSRSIIDTELNCRFELVEKEYMEMHGEIINILKSLDMRDRRLLILYTELESLRKVARIYNCSEGTIRNQLKSIKQKFQHLYENRYEYIDQSPDDDNNYCVHHRPIRNSDTY